MDTFAKNVNKITMDLSEHKPGNIFHGPEGAEIGPDDYDALEKGAREALNALEEATAGPTGVERTGVKVQTELPDLGPPESGTNPPEWPTDYMASQEQATDQPNDQRVTRIEEPATTLYVGDETPAATADASESNESTETPVSVVDANGNQLPLDQESLQRIADANADRLRVTAKDGSKYSLVRLGNTNNYRAQKIG